MLQQEFPQVDVSSDIYSRVPNGWEGGIGKIGKVFFIKDGKVMTEEETFNSL